MLSITYNNGSLILLAMLRHWQREYLADFKLAFEDLGARKGGLELKDREEVGKDWGGGSEGNAHAACVWNRLPSSHTADLCCFQWFQEPKEWRVSLVGTAATFDAVHSMRSNLYQCNLCASVCLHVVCVCACVRVCVLLLLNLLQFLVLVK